MTDQKDVDFKLFTVMWNQTQKQKSPDIHLNMATWLEKNWQRKILSMLLMAFRSSGKSTLAGLFAAWLLYRNPDLRILVLAADSALAKKMVRQVKKIIERHPLTKALKPDSPDQWAGERFTVKRKLQLRDPSMLARGIGSNITGCRADIVICDDVEVPNTCDTEEKREDLRTRLAEINYILVPGGTQLYIGTPHNYYTIYATTPRADIAEEKAFLDGFERFELPVIDGEGFSVWPEKFPLQLLEKIKSHTGPNKFSSQMMLQPMNITESRLDPDLLRVYSDPLDYTKELDTIFIGQKKMVGVTAFWDPAFGKSKGDKSVLAVVFADAEGNLYLHKLLYIKVDQKSEETEAIQQCRAVANMAKELFLPSVAVETNGLGQFLPRILRQEMVKVGASAGVVGINNSQSKDKRILEAFDAVLAARKLYVHKSIFETRFIVEMREWRFLKNDNRDDGLDATASALAMHPIRMVPLKGPLGGYTWMNSGVKHHAKTDFDI